MIGRARAQVEAFGLTGHPGAALVYAVSACVRSQAGRVDQATIDLRQATVLFERLRDPAPWYEAEVRIAQAQAALRLSDAARAKELLAAASRVVRREPSGVVLAARLRTRLARADGAHHSAAAARVVADDSRAAAASVPADAPLVPGDCATG